MPPFVKKLLFFFSFLALFVLVILYIEPPKSWPEASIFQMMAFFLPILLAITALVDILMHYLPHSFILALGIILGLAFYAVNQLNILSGLLVLLITLLSYRVFPKMKLPRFRLTSGSKIPKLHMRKQEVPKIRRLRRLRHG
jgi:hypothetical protein